MFATVAVGAAAFVTSASPAHAASCTAWKLDAAALVINQDNGIVVSVDWPANANRPTSGSYLDFKGPATGGIVGGNKLDFTIDFVRTWSGAGDGPAHYSNHYTGTIEQVMEGFGRASGTTVNNLGASNTWTANEAFTCVVAPQPEPQPEKKVEQAPPPVEQAPPPVEKPPTDAVRMLIARSGLNVTVRVTSTSSIPGHCTYTADEVNEAGPQATEEFDIAKRGSHEFRKLAPVLAQKYHVVLSCRGDFNGQNVEFGHQEQDVTAFG